MKERYFPLCLLVLCAAIFFPALGARDLWAPVEPRYAEIARIMWLRNEWIVPTVNGEVYTDKPIFYFWLVLIFSKLAGGVSEWTVRLPAALGATGFVLVVYLTGREFFSARVGALAAGVLATTFRVIWEARWAHTDMLFGFFFVLTVHFGARCVFQRGRPNEILFAYFFSALATLTKGFIGVVLPALLFLAFLFARRDRRLLGMIHLPLGIVIFALVAGPWFYFVSKATDGTWLHDFVYVHHIARYTAGAGHRQPFYYYLTTLPADFLPWTAFLIPAVVRRSSVGAWKQPRAQFFVLWFAIVFIFFSLSDTKRDLYLLPLFPPVAFFIAGYLDAHAEEDWRRRGFAFWFPGLFFGMLGVFGTMLPALAWANRPEMVRPLLPAALALAVGGIATVIFISRYRPMSVILSVGLLMAGFTVSVVWSMFPYLEQFKSHREFSAEINRLAPKSAPLYVYEDTTHDFNYYTEREKIAVLDDQAEIARLRAGEEKSYILIKQRALEKLPEAASAPVVIRRTIGNTTWYLLALGRQAG